MKEILVFAHWQPLPDPVFMGTLRADQHRGKEVFSFSYDPTWLENGNTQELDPGLRLYSGPQYLNEDKPNFGLFLDSSPDRWGRTLMKRREALRAKDQGRSPKTLYESDFLLGVTDETRMGALRFKLDPTGPFLDESGAMPTPPITSIRELEQASLRYEEDNFIDDPQAKDWLGVLIAPGSSLGGARPKANVIDPDGHLWIAKFPSRNDEKDSGAWEYIIYQMAIECGIRMSLSSARIHSQSRHTFLTRRFDRIGKDRIHYASAMTLLGHKDGYDSKDGGSYLEMIDLIKSYGADPTNDIRELWQRIVFSVAISNTDDHLRNHGFMLIPDEGWKLCPAYDLNPIPDGHGLSLNIDEHDNRLSFDLCLQVHPYFRWKAAEANEEVRRIRSIVSTWEKRAKAMNLSRTEIESVRPAFEKQFK